MSNFHKNIHGENALDAKGENVLKINQKVSVGGNTDLSQIIRGPDGATVYKVKLIRNAGTVWDYELWVEGKGPKGAGSGDFKIRFRDQTGDVYSLSLRNSTKGFHRKKYNSKKPNIDRIEW